MPFKLMFLILIDKSTNR